jgi:alpha-aminoadipate/glutamate carrier protein LysW
LTPALYNTLACALPPQEGPRKERTAVTKCPDCDAELDLDEDEVEEGEILSCPECDIELEVTQIHPVHLIKISEDEDEDEEDEEDDEEAAVVKEEKEEEEEEIE